jgi:hypothetical protein
LAAVRPVTGSLKVIVQESVSALVGLGPPRVIERTTGWRTVIPLESVSPPELKRGTVDVLGVPESVSPLKVATRPTALTLLLVNVPLVVCGWTATVTTPVSSARIPFTS